jgi:hypothetical protein
MANINNDVWANYLAKALSSYMNGNQIRTILGYYEAMASQTTRKKAFQTCLESWGNQYANDSAIDKIEKEIERINSEKIELDPVRRIRQTISRMNDNLQKCSVEINGIDDKTLAPHQKEQLQISRQARQTGVKIVVPEALKEKTFQALGKYNHRIFKLELEVKL